MEPREESRCNSTTCRNHDFIQQWYCDWRKCDADQCCCEGRGEIRICATCFTVQHTCQACKDIITIAPPKHSRVAYQAYSASSFGVLRRHYKTLKHLNNINGILKDAATTL